MVVHEQPWTLVAAIAATLGAWMCTLTEFWLMTHAGVAADACTGHGYAGC